LGVQCWQQRGGSLFIPAFGQDQLASHVCPRGFQKKEKKKGKQTGVTQRQEKKKK